VPGEVGRRIDTEGEPPASSRLTELLITWLRGGIEMEWEHLIEDCVALFVATAESAAALANHRAAPALHKRRPSAA
jgi:hypothetical protein